MPGHCNPMDCSTPGFPVLHGLPEFAQIHVHQVGDAIQPSHCFPLLLLPSIFPSIRMNQLFTSGGQSIGASASASVLPMNIQGWFPLGLTGLISLLFQESSPAPQFESINSLVLSLLDGPTLTFIHDYQKNHTLTIWTFVGKVMSLLFNMLSILVIAFLPRSKRLLISWLQSWSAVILDPKIIKSVTVSIVFPPIFHEVMGPDAMILVFWMLSFKPIFSLSSFTLVKRLFSSSLLYALEWYHLHVWGCYFSQQSWFQVVSHSAQCVPWCTLHLS